MYLARKLLEVRKKLEKKHISSIQINRFESMSDNLILGIPFDELLLPTTESVPNRVYNCREILTVSQLKALLFDLGGTLIDTEKIRKDINFYTNILAQCNIPITKKKFIKARKKSRTLSKQKRKEIWHVFLSFA